MNSRLGALNRDRAQRSGRVRFGGTRSTGDEEGDRNAPPMERKVEEERNRPTGGERQRIRGDFERGRKDGREGRAFED